MTIKTYMANTNISINVVLPSKKNFHITFTPLSNGSSVFTTDNEIWFFVKFGGNLFFISPVFFFLNPIKSCRYVCFLVTLKTPHH